MKRDNFSERRRQILALGTVGAGALAAPAAVMAAHAPVVQFSNGKMVVSGRVIGAPDGKPLSGAQIEIWPVDARGVRSETAHEVITADGDGRYFLNLVEEIYARGDELLDLEALGKVIAKRLPLYDKASDGHYNLISALHKSVRGSDPDAALYYLARMLTAGEDPLFLARRIVRMAIEDVGLADPQALTQALAAKDTFEFLGSPEGELALAQAVIYVASAPKSNSAYNAFSAAMAAARETGSLPPPKIILNAPTKLMKSQDYGSGYRYDHDEPDAFSGQNYFPDQMGRRKFYAPVERGFERDVQKRLDYWEKLRRERNA